MQNILLFFIRVYQLSLSYFVGGWCRFEPTCSHYASEAIIEHGIYRGLVLAVRRILRCHPWGGSGYDAVPPNDRDRDSDSDKTRDGV